MTQQLGKDALLEDSIAHMSNLLARLGFELEEVGSENPIAHVWFVEVRDKRTPLLKAKGKGTHRQAAKASAMGEFIERLSTNYFFADYYWGAHNKAAAFVHYPNERWFDVTSQALPEGLLDEATLSHYNLDENLTAQMLVDHNSGNRQRGICALPFECQRGGATTWIPVNILGNLFGSNGMAAGNSKYEARVQALSEIFERHIKNTILSAGISLPRIPDEVVAQYPQVVASLDALRAQGYVVYVLDASLAGKFPLVNITVMSAQTGSCLAAFGAHPKFAVALERAVIELLQGRSVDALATYKAPVLDLQDVADQANLERHFADSSGVVSWELLSGDSDYVYTPWNIEGDTQAEFEHLCYLIHRVDMDIYISDYEHLGMYACRIVVPGMSELYPVETLVVNNNNNSIFMREVLSSLPEQSDGKLRKLYDLLDSLLLPDDADVGRLLGVLPDKGHWLDGLCVGELKCLLALKLGFTEEALEFASWLLDSVDLASGKQCYYRCLKQVLQFSADQERTIEHFYPVLCDLYGQSLVERCLLHASAEEVFKAYTGFDLSLKAFKTHSQLLDVYAKLQTAKSKKLI